MQIGIIGAGAVGSEIARYAVRAGHDVVLASRHPEKISDLAKDLGVRVRVGDATAAAAADLVVLAVPWPAKEDALGAVADWSGKILVDATNAFDQVTPSLVLADTGGRGSSEIVADLARGARVVKAFNSITMANFSAGPKRGDATRVLLVSGDDADAKGVVAGLIESFGFAAVDLGGLVEGGRRQQAGQPLATGRDLLFAGAGVTDSQ